MTRVWTWIQAQLKEILEEFGLDLRPHYRIHGRVSNPRVQ